MAPTQTLTMPAPVPPKLSPYRRLRAVRSISKFTSSVKQSSLFEKDENTEEGVDTAVVLSRTTVNAPLKRPSTSPPSAESGAVPASPSDSAPPLSPSPAEDGQLQSVPQLKSGTANVDDAVVPRDEQDEEPSRERRGLGEEATAKWAEDVARVGAEPERVPADKKSVEDAGARIGPQTQTRAQAQAVVIPSPPASVQSSGKGKSPALGIFNLLTRGRKSNATTMSTASSMRSSTDISNSDSLDAPVLTAKSFVEPEGKGIVPQTDAPVSASNGGEQEISVRCRGVVVKLKVGSDTNALDILAGCSAKVTTPISTANSAVVEMYNQLGLERRVRPYELARDILNSWDRNARNCLVVVQRDAIGSDEDVDSDVPSAGQCSRGFVLQLYHSQQPRRWNKRYVTLLENGQIHSSKKPDANFADKDVPALCHLSDFDIYTPTEKQLQQLHPPKKYCYAIKSQQKATLFVESQNFVHFFCTDDPDLAHTFHSLVRGWRSQYLANKMIPGGIRKRLDKPPQIRLPAPVSREPKKTVGHVQVNGHKVRVSVDESPYALGAFEPLLDLGRFDKPLDDFGKDWIPERKPEPVREESKTDSEKPGEETKKEKTDGVFAANGLLGEAYDQRKKGQKNREAKDKPKSGGDGSSKSGDESSGSFTPGSLLSGGKGAASRPDKDKDTKESTSPSGPKPDAPSWFPSAVEHSARERIRTMPQKSPPTNTRPQLTTMRERLMHSYHTHHQGNGGGTYAYQQHRRRRAHPAPLIDLTPIPPVPPQWSSSASTSSTPSTPTATVSTPISPLSPSPVATPSTAPTSISSMSMSISSRDRRALRAKPVDSSPSLAAALNRSRSRGTGHGLVAQGGPPTRPPPNQPPPPVPVVPARAFGRGVGAHGRVARGWRVDGPGGSSLRAGAEREKERGGWPLPEGREMGVGGR